MTTTETGLSATQPKGLTLATIQDAMTFGKMVADSQFAPKDFRGRPADCVLAIQHGAEVGLSPMQSLQSIAVINGRPSLWGDAAKALCIGSPVCEFIVERVEGDGEAMVATCTAKRVGQEPVVSTFSVADAKRAKLWGKTGPWTEYPRRMLTLRARGFALRDAFPDLLRGLITAEEAADYPTTPRTQSRPAGGTTRTKEAPAGLPAPAPAPKPEPTATGEDLLRARLAIQRATTPTTLARVKATVDDRAASGFYLQADAAELRTLIAERQAAIRRAEQAIPPAGPDDQGDRGDAAEPPLGE